MGRSVKSQIDPNEFFSLSTIDKNQIKTHGLNLRIKDLKVAAKNANPFGVIYTGEDYPGGRVKRTNIYRYDDFKQIS